jgi:aryl-alcohol dehydrogenase-like predicted oxidoreductase
LLNCFWQALLTTILLLVISINPGGMMFTRRLGRSNLEISAMGLGCWAIGGPWTYDNEPAGWGQIDDSESIRAIHYALEAGINFFDTAANYGCGHSERILGQAIAGRRDKVILATKFGYIIDETNRVVARNDNEVVKRIRQDCEASLRRLKTDYIDLYQFHRDDYALEKAGEVRDFLETLVQEGKIRWYGWSTVNPEGPRVFAQGEHCTAIQHWMNMGTDMPEMLAVCEKYDQASIIRSPLGSGNLTGKFNSETVFPKDDMRSPWNMRIDWWKQRFQRIGAVRKFFAETGDARTQAQIALAWVWTRSPRTIPIPGFKTLAQVQENIQAMEFGLLNDVQMQKIDEIFERAPAQATER